MTDLGKNNKISYNINKKFDLLFNASTNNKNKLCFIIKILNYEFLSILLHQDQLDALLKEVEDLIIHTLTQASYPPLPNQILSSEAYISCFTAMADDFAISHISYLIYHNLQLYISKIYPSVNLECKISTMILAEDLDVNRLRLKNLLCSMTLDKKQCYYVQFNENAIQEAEQETTTLNSFKEAILARTYVFAFQQIIDATTGEIPYYESLLRIPDENGRLVSAGSVIQAAEKAGLNNVLDQLVLNMIVDELRHAPEHVNISVNISNAGVLDSNLVHTARSLLEKHPEIARRLIIEITETSLNIDFQSTKDFCEMMRRFGCKISLDDFGSGFTSFKQLQKLPIDVLKIDGGFIKDIIENKRDQDLVKSLIVMARNLEIKTVAEYVENGEIAKFLLDAGVDYMQGHFFSPAVNNRVWVKN